MIQMRIDNLEDKTIRPASVQTRTLIAFIYISS